MIGLADYHTHTVLSDGKGSHEEMVVSAMEKGLDEIGFSDHVCLKPVPWAINPMDLPVMTSQIQELRSRYSDRIKIKYGIEMDYFPGKETDLRQIIESVPVDYVIGSVHFIGDWNFDTDKSLYGKWTNDELYRMYFHLIQQAATSGLFDVIGHLDIIKKFQIYPETDQEALFDETVRIIAQNHLIVELNTGGADRPCGEFTPSRRLLELCHHYQVDVTLSSDAHSPAQVARHYETAVDLLKEVGYTHITTFTHRERGKMRL